MTHIFQPAKARGIVAVRAESDPAALVTALNKDWQAFKDKQDQREQQIAAKFDDIVTKDELSKIDASVAALTTALDDANAKIAGISLNGGAGDDGLTDQEREYAAKFSDWFRTGDGERELKALAKAGGIKAAYSVGSDPDGGYTAPIEWDRTITDKRVEVSPMRRFASVQSVSGQGFKKLYNLRGTDAAWVGKPPPVRKLTGPSSRNTSSPLVRSTRCRRRLSASSRTRKSTLPTGWLARSTPSSRVRKGLRSSMAMA